jgi:hypothetical protein
MDRAKAVWKKVAAGRPSAPWRWRRLAVAMRGRNGTTPCVRFTDPDGCQRFTSVAKLHRVAFLDPPPLPEGNPVPCGDDDEGIEDLPPPTLPPARRPSVAPSVRPMLPRGMPRRKGDDGDGLAGDWLAPVATIPPAPWTTVVIEPLPDPSLPDGPHAGRFAKGTGHWGAKLDETKVGEMRRLRLEGWSTNRLAERFGVARNTVCYALNGTTWSHVTAGNPAIGGSR